MKNPLPLSQVSHSIRDLQSKHPESEHSSQNELAARKKSFELSQISQAL